MKINIVHLLIRFPTGVCFDWSQVCVLHVHPTLAHAGTGGAACDGGSKKEDHHWGECGLQLDIELIKCKSVQL